MLRRGKNKDKKISEPVLGLGIALVLPSTTSLADLAESTEDDPDRLAPPPASVRHGLTWKVHSFLRRPHRNWIAKQRTDEEPKAESRASLTPPKAAGVKVPSVSPSPSLLGSKLHILRRTTSRISQLTAGNDGEESKVCPNKGVVHQVLTGRK